MSDDLSSPRGLPAKKRRRLPFKAVVEEREEPFLAADLADLEAECLRITNGAEFLYSMERNGVAMSWRA